MKHLLLTTIAAVLVWWGVVSRSSRLLHQKRSQLNQLPNRRQPKHQTSIFTRLLCWGTSKLLNNTLPLERM